MATTTKKTAAAAPAPAKKATAGAVAVRKNNAVVPAALAAQMAEDSGRGMEKVDADSVAIPFLAILQSNSPACDPDSGEFISDARPGMLMNTVTRDIWDGKEGLLFVPCHYQRKFLKWLPRKAGGGFKGEVPIDAVARMQEEGSIIDLDNRLYVADDRGSIDPDKSILVADTRVHYIMYLDPETEVWHQAVLSLASTQIKKSKQLMAMLGNVLVERADGTKVTPATFANLARLTTVPESNEKGKWNGAKVELEGLVDDATLYAKAKEFHALISKGKATVNYDAAAAEGLGADGGAGPGDDEPAEARRGEPEEPRGASRGAPARGKAPAGRASRF